MLRPISRTVAGKLPDTSGMKRNPMRRTSPYLTALSVANVWSFNRLSKRLGMCATIEGSVSQTRHGLRLRQTG
jgi:type II secretory pathway component PulK